MDRVARREYDTQRKREYRALKRKQASRLHQEILVLEDHLQQLGRARQQARLDWVRASRRTERDTMETNKTLRDQVRYHGALVRTLQVWTTSVQPSIDGTTSWLNSTLLADPVARQYGYQWLTDRALHVAEIDGQHALGSSVADVTQLRVVLDASSNDVVGFRARHQSTLLGNFKDAAKTLWQHMNGEATATHVDHAVVYSSVYSAETQTSKCMLMRRYEFANRVIFVKVFVRDDECVPLQPPHDVRPHGLCYRLFHHITDDVTLVRSAVYQSSPVTTDGSPYGLARMAAMFGVHPASQDATVARIETNAQRCFETQEAAIREAVAHVRPLD
ncbi:Aste57867_16464 [Aphanomyces stellatus]|uniref:Aste57867_16464 protein n=1 Tax=Aphanomyces stellatus TaxID=120398 RepID=A0A485L7E4_9STRA|nr:hypothetical protein As57867_016407 [Aphanomyces stellatus]VFT93238.1 Aste57867_16464 [Aphanomyces stellatus]